MARYAFICAVLFGALSAHAEDEMDSAITAMCENVKRCTITHLEAKQQVTEQAKTLLFHAFDQKCTKMRTNYHNHIPKASDDYSEALTCLKELSTASCETLMKNPEGMTCFTPNKS